MPLNYTLIGQRLKSAREKCKYTQSQLAEVMEISNAYVSRIECGKAQINLKRLSEICKILKISELYAIHGTNSDSEIYLEKEFSDILRHCTAKEKEFSYKLLVTLIDELKKIKSLLE